MIRPPHLGTLVIALLSLAAVPAAAQLGLWHADGAIPPDGLFGNPFNWFPDTAIACGSDAVEKASFSTSPQKSTLVPRLPAARRRLA